MQLLQQLILPGASTTEEKFINLDTFEFIL